MNKQKFIFVDNYFINITNVITIKLLLNLKDNNNLLELRINTIERNNDKSYSFPLINKRKYKLEKIDNNLIKEIKEQLNYELFNFLENDEIIFNIEQMSDSIVERLSLIKKDNDKNE